jgi:quaternary ammonium compound-resistance protein SugE
MNINWLFLIVGGLFETGFAMSLGKMQYSGGKQAWLWFFSFLVCVSLSMYLLYKAMGNPHPIPAGTAYAVWAGIGAIGTVVLGILIFKEPITFWRMFFLATLIISIVGLQITTQNTTP